MKLTIDELLKSRVRNREKLIRAVRAIDRLRRKTPPGWSAVKILRKLREKR